MFVVIFRAKARDLDAEYSAMAAQMRQLIAENWLAEQA